MGLLGSFFAFFFLSTTAALEADFLDSFSATLGISAGTNGVGDATGMDEVGGRIREGRGVRVREWYEREGMKGVPGIEEG